MRRGQAAGLRPAARHRGGRACGLLVVAALALMLPAAASADQGHSIAADWLPPASHIDRLPSIIPRTPLRDAAEGANPSFLVTLGELVFRSPELLGGNAQGAGLRCNGCHSSGDRNRSFFIPGLSGPPGTVDVTNHLWNPENDDHRDDPLRIPSLRDVAQAAPYGFRGLTYSLRDFVRHVIVVEFSGAEPQPKLFDALIAYLDALAPLPDPLLTPDGSLAAAASPAARQGERIFDQACAACHTPEQGFRDGRLHDVGSGGPVETPTLLGTAAGGPYFHDGRYATLEAVIGHHQGGLSAKAAASEMVRADLLAYLTTIGGGERPVEPVTLHRDFARLERFLALLHEPLASGDGALTGEISLMLRDELGRIDARFPAQSGAPATAAAARELLLSFGRALDTIGQEAQAGRFAAARADLADLEPRIAAAPARLEAALPGSLYLKAAGAK